MSPREMPDREQLEQSRVEAEGTPEPTDEEIAAAIQRARERSANDGQEFAHEPANYAPSNVVPMPEKKGKKRRIFTEADNRYCERCGGVEGHVVVGNHPSCRCPKLFAKQAKILANIDPEGRISFGSAEGHDASLNPVLRAGREIATGKRKRGLILFGKPGVGKTFAAISTVRAALKAGRLAGYFNVADLVSRIQATYSGDGESRFDVIKEVALHEIAVLDDLGKEHASANVESIVYELIDTLYRRERVMIVCSNLLAKRKEKTDPPGFIERYDDAVRSRLAGGCEMLVVRGEDRRLAQWDWS